ncbi:transposase [Amaricoccus solimangrovi]|uniref:Transposase n=1 Tax=Amaricoccus solimangrovi TaxID=2589815 RepID=A0A501WEC2_9RHOB|nr:transposase [Amaricoccus solimangrovi]TPE46855.1 transposase [Amaricoccus solimangrovi]
MAVEVFRACRPARGAKARSDRLFLEAPHFFAVHNIRRLALPERFCLWNSVRKRFSRHPRMVHWFNERRLLEPIGNIPPAEAEANYFAGLETPAVAA